jgi:hypothetical protein
MHEPQTDQLVAGDRDKKNTRSHESLNAAASATGAIEGLSPTSLAAFRLYLILLVPCMASVVVGYDISSERQIRGDFRRITHILRSHELYQWNGVCMQQDACSPNSPFS